MICHVSVCGILTLFGDPQKKNVQKVNEWNHIHELTFMPFLGALYNGLHSVGCRVSAGLNPITDAAYVRRVFLCCQNMHRPKQETEILMQEPPNGRPSPDHYPIGQLRRSLSCSSVS